MGKVPDLLDWHHVDRHYDFSKPKRGTMGARDFCDMIIHSFVFSECLNEDRTIDGFLVTSDKLKTKGLWHFEIGTVIGLMERTAADNPPTAFMSRDPDTGELEVWAGHEDEPPVFWKKKVEELAARRGALWEKQHNERR
jgi:hypothetical protein